MPQELAIAHRLGGSACARRASSAPLRTLLSSEMLALADQVVLRQPHSSIRIQDGISDPVCALALAAQDGNRERRVGFPHHRAETDPHVEDAEHLGVSGPVQTLDNRKNGGNRRQCIENITDIGFDAGQIQKSVAGDEKWAVLMKAASIKPE